MFFRQNKIKILLSYTLENVYNNHLGSYEGKTAFDVISLPDLYSKEKFVEQALL